MTNYAATGFPDLDNIAEYPLGCISTLYGPARSGKTVLGLAALAAVQCDGYRGMYLDYDGSFNLKRAEKLGVDIQGLDLHTPADLTSGVDLIRQAVEAKIRLVVVDSVLQMVSGKDPLGTELQNTLAKLVPYLSGSSTALLLLCQSPRKGGSNGVLDFFSSTILQTDQLENSLKISVVRYPLLSRTDRSCVINLSNLNG